MLLTVNDIESAFEKEGADCRNDSLSIRAANQERCMVVLARH
jgi:hypothetical protein